jgi:hypothetical protein
MVMREAVAEHVQARQRALDRLELAVWSMRERAREIRPERRQLLGDEEAPEAKTQLADRLPVARALTLLPDAVSSSRDIRTRPVAQLVGGIVQPGSRPAEPVVASREPLIEGVSDCDLQVSDRLPDAPAPLRFAFASHSITQG